MTDSATAPAEATPPAPSSDTTANLGGVAAEAAVGGLSTAPQSPAPAADNPVGAADVGIAQEPAGQAQDAAVENVTTLGVTDPGLTSALAAQDILEAAHTEVMREVQANLNALEQLAVFWGGDTGTRVRNHVGRIQDLLVLR